jgi:UDP-N-acetylglucosamine 2-epimerase (non-hydrolysing)
MVTAMCAFYRRIPFYHVEAGLRTGDMYYPFPEEMNRVVAGHLATLHFSPTDVSRRNLLREGISDDKIYVTGNTVIDALLHVADKKMPLGVEIDSEKKIILVTAHRRENFGAPFMEICQAIREIAEHRHDVVVLYPVHPNPNIHDVVYSELSNYQNILLTPPLEYGAFVTAMNKAYIILTDSGGVQEEAPALGKPVLVLRDETERPEAVDAGVVRLVGPNKQKITSEVYRLLDNAGVYRAMSKGASPYGDGNASVRIVDALLENLVHQQG